MKIKTIKIVIGSLAVVIIAAIAIKTNIEPINEIQDTASHIQDTNDNLVNVYDNGYKLYKKVKEDEGKEVKDNQVKSISLLETDFNYCKFNVLGFWNEEAADEDIYYKNEPEATEVLEEETEGESIEVGSGVEIITETTEIPKEIKPRTFIILNIAGYYNDDTINGMYFEFYNGEELIGTTKKDKDGASKNIGVTQINKVNNETVLMFELPGNYKQNSIYYKPVVTNNTNIVEGELRASTLTEVRQSRNYDIFDINGNSLLVIKKESTEGSNRIDLIDITEEETTESETEESVEDTQPETKEVAETQLETKTIAETKKQEIGPGYTTEAETNETVSIKSIQSAVKKKYKKYQKEVYNLSYSFECWGKSDTIKELNGSDIEIVRKDTGETVEVADNIQIKYNDSKYSLSESDDIFVELSFSVNIQISKDKLNEYLQTNGLKQVSSQTINTVKSSLNSIFSLKVYNDGNKNLLNDLR